MSNSTKSTDKTSSVPKYETDFLKWYKNSYGTDYQGGSLSKGTLSDGEFDVGQTLHKYYLQEQQAKEQKDAALEKLRAERSAAEQSASITYDKLQKYLPQQLRAQGLGNLGVSDSALLDAGNQYIGTMSRLAGDYGQAEMSLEEAYGEKALERDLAKSTEVNGILDVYRTKTEEEALEAEADLEAKQKNTYDRINSLMSGGYFGSAEDLRAYLENEKGNLSEDQYKTLDQMARYLETSPYYKTEAEQLSEQEKTQREEETFANLEYLISGGYYNNPDELRAMLDESVNDLSPSQYKLLDQMITYLQESSEEAARKEAEEDQKEFDENYTAVTVPKDFQYKYGDAHGSKIIKTSIGNKRSKKVYFNKNTWTTSFAKGDNFEVKGEGDGLTYKVQSGGEETDENVLKAALDVPNDTVFACNQKIYLKRQGKVFVIEARDISKKDHYEKLYEMFYG